MDAYFGGQQGASRHLDFCPSEQAVTGYNVGDGVKGIPQPICADKCARIK